MARIRPLTPVDVDAAAAVAAASIAPYFADDERPALDALTSDMGAKTRHLLGTDPGGCWVAADDDGAVVGMALALVRDGLWGLSQLGVAPGRQGQGIGRPLLEAAHAYGSERGARAAMVMSSSDPRAMRRYHRLGLGLLPTVSLAGPLAAPVEAPATVRVADPVHAPDRATAAIAERAGRHVRGAAYAPADLAYYAATGRTILVHDDGFAVHRDGSPRLLAATTEAAATDLLHACLAAAPAGARVHVTYLTAGNDWAIGAGLDAGLALEPEGPLFAAGPTAPRAPWVPSGAFL